MFTTIPSGPSVPNVSSIPGAKGCIVRVVPRVPNLKCFYCPERDSCVLFASGLCAVGHGRVVGHRSKFTVLMTRPLHVLCIPGVSTSQVFRASKVAQVSQVFEVSLACHHSSARPTPCIDLRALQVGLQPPPLDSAVHVCAARPLVGGQRFTTLPEQHLILSFSDCCGRS